jgi:TRAP-type C4-dicarboxylate transport system permease small subunit
MKALDRLTTALEGAFMLAAAAGLMAIMLVVVADVVLRYAFASPLGWSYDVISMYLVTLVFYMALADTFRRGGHIRIDLFESWGRSRVFAACQIAGLASAIVFFALIARLMATRGWEGYVARDVMDGAIAWPTWPPFFVGAAGVGLLILRLALALAARLSALAAGHAYADPHAHAGPAELAE